MRISYFITGIILASGLTFLSISCGDKPIDENAQITSGQDTAKPKTQPAKKESPYEGLRNMAFAVTPDQLGLSLPFEKTVVYGAIMDWGIDSATATIVSYQTGDASLYLSSGGGVIGGGQHKNVNRAAKKFVLTAQNLLNQTTKAETTPLPEKDMVLFYLLTNKGIYVGQERMKNIDNNSSPWMKLFEEGNNVLAELRKTSEK
jgi:hypothetical protein